MLNQLTAFIHKTIIAPWILCILLRNHHIVKFTLQGDSNKTNTLNYLKTPPKKDGLAPACKTESHQLHFLCTEPQSCTQCGLGAEAIFEYLPCNYCDTAHVVRLV
jgi:hypothetical protein